jgi:hypothetical protein
MTEPSVEHAVVGSEGTAAVRESEHAETRGSDDNDHQQSGISETTEGDTEEVSTGLEAVQKEDTASTPSTTADPKELPHTPLPTTSSPALPPVPEPDNLPVIKLKPRRPRPPKKGILKPPSTAPANSSRFSFRRDILQPLQYSRLAGGVVPVSSGLPSTVAVGEAMNSAATAAGGWMGSALKRLGQAAGVAAEGAGLQQQQHQVPQNASAAPGRTPSTSSNTQSTNPPVDSLSSTQTPSQQNLASPVPPTSATPTSPPPPPSQPLQPSLSVQSLKQVRFRMQSLAVVYPINGASSSSFSPTIPSPSSPNTSNSRPPPARHTTFFNDLKVGFHPGPPLAPAEEAETRKRVDKEWRTRIKMRTRTSENGSIGIEKGKERSRIAAKEEESKGWTGAELERLYRECCRTREEPGIERLKRILRVGHFHLVFSN